MLVEGYTGKSHQTVGFVYSGQTNANPNYLERRNRFLQSVNKPNTMKVDIVSFHRTAAWVGNSYGEFQEDGAKRIDHAMTKLSDWARKQGYAVTIFFMP